jgi:hypothetical protein
MILALYEAGYLSPFMLSKKEADAYRQIRAEVKGYRRVRKYEMIFILISFTLFMLLFPLTIYGLIATHLDIIQITSSYPYLYLYYYAFCPLFISIFIGHIWRKGQISRQDLIEIIKDIKERLSFLKGR